MPCAGVRFKLLSVGDHDIRRALDAALNAELLLDLCDAVEHVLKFLPVHHLITQGVHVGLDSSHARQDGPGATQPSQIVYGLP
jgi:hypothetical protein